MPIRARAPLRLGLAGGGTDVSPYCDVYGGYVLNATIDRYAYATIKKVDASHVRFVASDQQAEVIRSIAEVTELMQSSAPLSGKLVLHQAVYNEIIRLFNGGVPIPIEMHTFCDAPIGSGLGASSTLVVAMIRAFAELLNLPLDDYAIAKMAFKVERVDCGMRGGHQDQYSATFGGFNFMEFYAEDRVIVNPLRIKNWILCELEASLLLFYTGISRDSAKIIETQSSHVQTQDSSALDAMHGMKKEALAMKECVLKGDFDGIVGSMKAGWESKKRSSNAVSNSHIDSICEAAMSNGARAAKVSGAGGGGFVMFFVPSDQRLDVIRALQNFDGQISNCHFTKQGTQAWYIP
jgi:D-glycero-alpha-D-manno-heptose-7-phosphate kinase